MTLKRRHGLHTLSTLETTLDSSVITGVRPTLSLTLPSLLIPDGGISYSPGHPTSVSGTETLTVDVLRRPSTPLVLKRQRRFENESLDLPLVRHK